MNSPSANVRVHNLKVWPEFFDEIMAGNKTFEIRYNDRDYRVGDLLVLREFQPYAHEPVEHPDGYFTGLQVARVVRYMTDFEQRPGYVVMGFRHE